jgi:uncharacterized BrkB/YihY/UPF0761 family membrane protein
VNFKQNLLRSLVTLFLLAIFLELVLQPTTSLGPFVSLAIILVLDAAAFLVSFGVGGGRVGQFVRLLLSSALLAGFFVYVLRPRATTFSNSFDSTFLAVFILQAGSLIVAWYFGKNKLRIAT